MISLTIKTLYKFSERRFGRISGKYPKIKKGQKGFVWVHLENPSRKELGQVQGDFGVPEKILARFPRELRSVRYSFSPLCFVLVDYYSKQEKVAVENVLFFVGENFMITVTQVPLAHYNTYQTELAERLKDFKPDVAYLLHEILDSDAEENFDVLKLTEHKILGLEEAVLIPVEVQKKLKKIIQFKRDLLLMWRRLWGTAKVIYSIRKGLTPVKLDVHTMRLLADVHDTYIYQMEIITMQREVLADALTIYEAVLSNKLSKVSNFINIGVKRLTWIMLLLTGVTLVITVPNTIATVFGVPHFLEVVSLNWILSLLALSTIVPVAWFLTYWHKVKKAEETTEKAQEMPLTTEKIVTSGATTGAASTVSESSESVAEIEPERATELL